MVGVLSGQGVGSTRLTPEPDLDHVSTDAPAPELGGIALQGINVKECGACAALGLDLCIKDGPVCWSIIEICRLCDFSKEYRSRTA